MEKAASNAKSACRHLFKKQCKLEQFVKKSKRYSDISIFMVLKVNLHLNANAIAW